MVEAPFLIRLLIHIYIIVVIATFIHLMRDAVSKDDNLIAVLLLIPVNGFLSLSWPYYWLVLYYT